MANNKSWVPDRTETDMSPGCHMAKRRVIAHFMHENERDQVTPYLSNHQVGEGLAYGEIEEADIENL